MADKLNVLLLVGGPRSWYHDQPIHREMLNTLFTQQFTVTMTDSPGMLIPEVLDQFDVIVSYSGWWEPTQQQCDSLMSAVREGKGFVCLHPSTASFFNSDEFLDMVGGEFVMHDPFKTFTVNVGAPSGRERWLERKGLASPKEVHPIIEGISDFEVQDELFYIQGDQTQWNILARAEGHPVVFTKSWGKGRVVNIALGHDDRPLSTPSVREMYLRGVSWAGNDL